jgi:hypothetical protein
MEFLLPMVIIVILGAVVAIAALRRAGPAGQPGGPRPDDDAVEWDEPIGRTGGGSPRRGGRPVPGSEEDRHRHGKP